MSGLKQAITWMTVLLLKLMSLNRNSRREPNTKPLQPDWKLYSQIVILYPTMEGLQWPVLGPACRFKRVCGQFIQILHTGNSHWVCVSSVGVSNGKVNLYDSLYHNVIGKEVEEQVINLAGTENYYGLQVVPVQQENNGGDCGVFAAAFATCLTYGILPQTIHMPKHLLRYLKLGEMELFPTFYKVLN